MKNYMVVIIFLGEKMECLKKHPTAYSKKIS